MRAYSTDTRARILAAIDAGMSKAQVARLFGVSEETVRRYAVQRRERGTLEPGRSPGRRALIRPEQREFLRSYMAQHPTATLAELCAFWQTETGKQVSITTMSRVTRELGWSRKKRRPIPHSDLLPSDASESR